MSAESSAPIRILAVDDHPVLRQGVAALGWPSGQCDLPSPRSQKVVHAVLGGWSLDGTRVTGHQVGLAALCL